MSDRVPSPPSVHSGGSVNNPGATHFVYFKAEPERAARLLPDNLREKNSDHEVLGFYLGNYVNEKLNCSYHEVGVLVPDVTLADNTIGTYVARLWIDDFRPRILGQMLAFPITKMRVRFVLPNFSASLADGGEVSVRRGEKLKSREEISPERLSEIHHYLKQPFVTRNTRFNPFATSQKVKLFPQTWGELFDDAILTEAGIDFSLHSDLIDVSNPKEVLFSVHLVSEWGIKGSQTSEVT